jgi:hypothetical protein
MMISTPSPPPASRHVSWTAAAATGHTAAHRGLGSLSPTTSSIPMIELEAWLAVYVYAANGDPTRWASWMLDPIAATPDVLAALAETEHDDADLAVEHYAALAALPAQARWRAIADLLRTQTMTGALREAAVARISGASPIGRTAMG